MIIMIPMIKKKIISFILIVLYMLLSASMKYLRSWWKSQILTIMLTKYNIKLIAYVITWNISKIVNENVPFSSILQQSQWLIVQIKQNANYTKFNPTLIERLI